MQILFLMTSGNNDSWHMYLKSHVHIYIMINQYRDKVKIRLMTECEKLLCAISLTGEVSGLEKPLRANLRLAMKV